MSKFTEGLKNESAWTKTENGLDALSTTFSALLDMYGNLLSYRYKDFNQTTQAFNKAWAEDPLLAMKLAFYARNIRGLGQGERRMFRDIVKYTAREHTEAMRKNFKLIPEFGRWDDLYSLVDTPLEEEMFAFLLEAFNEDLNANKEKKTEFNFVAKWLKSVRTHKKNNYLGKLTAKKFGMTEKEYRKKLAELRTAYNVVEKNLTAKSYDKINYEAVPSKAMKIYREVFSNNDTDRFCKYVEDLKSGKAKVNAGAIYPYEIMEKLVHCGWSSIEMKKDDVLEAQWKALPNYVEEPSDTLVVVDTSGSMSGRPLAIALSLGVYLAERNKGDWHNKMVTFSRNAKYIELKGETLYQKLNGIPSICENTNIESVFDLILNTAVNNNLKPEEMVKRVIIVSDMQFDSGARVSNRDTFTETMRKKFADKGYDLPALVYWNAGQTYENTFHSQKDVPGVALVSGASPSLFMEVLKDEVKTPLEIMLDTLSNPIFDKITV